ncbi:Signal transduction histidine kinase [Klenkia marina]|uniref:histidine kinase n=1 Tax=Klenkia marina TaxID=1960309 RepID=A0A1G4YW65_9ACTN|nr:HAMP domain-containing sensor histidine kinase [Klenkia marina]SCX57198.1 Signal transduction histidine kinase [Klenkia marina]
MLLRPGGALVVGALVLLAVAPGDDQHQLLAVAAALAFLAAGAAHLLRSRLTGNATNRQIGLALVALGLHLPAGFAVRVLLDEDGTVLAQGVEAAVIAAAAVWALRGLVPMVRPLVRQGFVAGVVSVAVVLLGLLASPDRAVVQGVLAAGYLGTALLWAAVAVVADRVDPLGDSGRSSSQAIALVAAAVAVGTACTGVAAVVTPGHLVRVLVDVLMLVAGLVAVVSALRRIGDALDGQERYVAALVEQLAHHELVLQQTRGCLHDARSALAGIQAATSATHHPAVLSDPRRRQQLERAAVDEMHRLQRMLRMPDRTPHVTEVDLDALLGSLVVVHRERGLRVRRSGDCPSVQADGDAVAVIVGNLLGNALVHAPGALVTVDVRVADGLTITVGDDGPGLTDLQRLGVFEAGARRDGSPGEGIGLAVSRDLARRHGGDLVARPSTTGAVFRLTLPLHAAVEPVHPVPGTGDLADLPGLRLAG